MSHINMMIDILDESPYSYSYFDILLIVCVSIIAVSIYNILMPNMLQ
jgi:hypothetical protein